MKENRFPESVFAPDGIHVDFVCGVRIGVPPRTPTFRYKLSDADTGEVYDYGESCGEDEPKAHLPAFMATTPRYVCIDADNRNLPAGAIDNTGKIPLPSRIDVLKESAFFIGLPSGLSWLAWACRKPVVMISGFTDAYVEFATPYRVSPPPGVCHGCWRTGAQRQKSRFNECYFGKDNECTKSITPEMVIAKIDQLIQQKAL